MAAEKFNNKESNASVRAKLNNHADEINANKEAIQQVAEVAGNALPADGLELAFETYLKNLPNWSADKVLGGNLEWIAKAATEKLTAPVLAVAGFGLTNISLTWGAIANADSYVLERSTSSNFSNPVIRYTGPLLAFNDTGLANGTLYYYRLTAKGAGYLDSDYGTISRQTSTPTPTTYELRYGIFDSQPDVQTMNFTSVMNVSVGTQTITIPYGNGVLSSDKWIGFEIPDTEADKLYWMITPLNKGTMGDTVMKDKVIVNNKKRYVSRFEMIFETGATNLIISENVL